MKRFSVRLASGIATAILLTAVMPVASAAAKTADVCTAARVGGGQVVVSTSLPITTLDPVNASGTFSPVRAGMPSFAMFDTVAYVDPQNKTHLRGMAQSLTANATNTEWTLKLKPGIKFGNGDPVNAAAVKASVERHVQPGLTSMLRTIYTANISAVTAPNDTTVVFTLKQSWAKFPEEFLAVDGGKIMNVALIKTKSDADFGLGKVPGAGIGAYEIVNWTPNESLTLKAKPDWWGGKLCVTDLKFVTTGTDDTALAGVANNQFGAAFLSDPTVVAQAQEKKLQTVPGAIYGAPGIYINMRAGQPGADLRVRQAIQLGLDPKQIASRVFPTVKDPVLVQPGKTWIPKSDPNFNKNMTIPETNVDKAKKLMDTVKAEGKFDGKIEMLALPTAPYNLEAQAVQAQLNAIGFNVTVTLASDVVARIDTTHNYQIAQSVLGGGPGVYQQPLQVLTPGGNNGPGYVNDRYISLVNGLNASVDNATYTKSLTEAANLIATDIPVVPLLTVSRAAIVSKTLKGVYAGRLGLLIFDKAYIKKAT